MAEGQGGRRDVLFGLAAAVGLLGVFAGVDRLLEHEREHMAQAEARVLWQQIADVLQGCMGEVPRTLDLVARAAEADPSGMPERFVERVAPGMMDHVPGLRAVGVEDAQGQPRYVFPPGHSLHADEEHLVFRERLRGGDWLVGVHSLQSARERMAARLATQHAVVRLQMGRRLLAQSGRLLPHRTAEGALDLGAHRLWLEVSSLGHPMSNVRMTLLGLGLVLSGPLGLAIALGRRAMRRRRSQAAVLEESAAARTREIEQERLRYRAFYRRVPVPCASLDGEWRLTDLNDAMLTALGVGRADALGRQLSTFMTDEARLRVSGVLRELVRRKKVENVEADLLRPDGTVARVRGDVMLDIDPSGAFREARLIGLDVTEVETLRRRASETSALATLGRFAGVISHEVRNPLSVATLANDVIERSVPTPELKKLCIRQRDALRTVERILSESLDFLRSPRLRASSVDLRTLLQGVAETTRAATDARAVVMRVQVQDGENVEFLADPHKLRQALVNLVENAVQACAPGEGRVCLSGRRSSDRVEIDVEDNGSGISDDRRERVFEPFFTSKGHGTGLGLAVVKQVIEAHGGHVWFDTSEGQGTTFHLSLPFRPAPVEMSTPAPRVAHSHRVLVVEDDPDSREILLGALRDAGHQVVGVANAEEALDRLAHQPPDIVISDYQLGTGGATGEAVVRAAHQHHPPIPAVLVTGTTAPRGDAEVALSKPLAVSELLSAIERLTHSK
jgi:PAS domain S-box-containing protein